LEATQRVAGNFWPSWRASRAGVFASEEEEYGSDFSFTHMRALLRDAKNHAIKHQAELVAQFKARVEAAGATVYEALPAADANRYMHELCIYDHRPPRNIVDTI
jgi:L-lactate dehydrogenase complex protein LldF